MEPPLDPLSDVVASLNVRTGSFSGLDAGGRWALRFDMHDHIKIGAVLSGSCLLSADGDEPVRLGAGDCFLIAARKYGRGQPPARCGTTSPGGCCRPAGR